ncbi:T9SS type A sorting domain-containing protein [Dyadobacter arcticus]|uniref:Secretion system C-terminal sorting domain-containing protein n=1 Tax=Dyadobacter arcticus TaxID=1078754 RepID=A0ABX0ULC1_9BACT|nr:T9SS type A sorting domain-containing protein [Dyadobacter arcticus]NIJ53806.1 hypothetical protein [Dyadobacter arcticus]
MKRQLLTIIFTWIVLLLSATNSNAQSFDQELKLVAGERKQNAVFGSSVAISSSGDYAVVGAPGDVGAPGEFINGGAYIFKKACDGNWILVQKVNAPRDVRRFGTSVAIDGDVVVVSDDNSVYVVKRQPSEVWGITQKFTGTSGFGNSVAISGDNFVVGHFFDDFDQNGANNLTDAGSATIFSKATGGSWVQAQRLVADDRFPQEYFGRSVSIGGDRVLIGAIRDRYTAPDESSNAAGSAYFFKKNSENQWVQEQKIRRSNPELGTSFGGSVSLHNNYAIVGAELGYYYDGPVVIPTGSAHIFELQNNGDWVEVRKLLTPGAASIKEQYGHNHELFGRSVSISGGYAVVSKVSNLTGSGGTRVVGTGLAYIYKRENNGDWTLLKEIAPDDGENGDVFGQSVFIRDEDIIVGAPSERDPDPNYLLGAAYIFQTPVQPEIASSGETEDIIIENNTENRLVTSDCGLIGTITGPNISNGSDAFTARVTIDEEVQTYSKQPYLQRHFDLEPGVANPSLATATVTLYVSQEEFTNFNAASTVKLPGNEADLENYKENLRIWQWHGTPTTTPSAPGSYTGSMAVPIDPADTDIKWIESLSAWEITFNVVGFSGFFITAENAEALPVTLVNFSGKKQEQAVQLDWQTTDETNSDRFEIQHSTDGKQWIQIGQVNAAGESKTLQRYTYTHANPAAVENLYKMKMVDLDGAFAFSKIVSVRMNGTDALNVFPNPATDEVSITSKIPIVSYQLLAANGEIIRKKTKIKTVQLELRNLAIPAGLYILKMTLENGEVEHRKLVIR